MSRKYVLPDPDDRTRNDPAIIVSSKQVMKLYNQYNKYGDKIQRVTSAVKDWFLKEVKNQGWDEATFSGNSCILINRFGNKTN
ncbi:MAG: hypothetical protein IJN64_06220 [Lachnospiraceae bacterium]|nr:hypothetical protein [Lachnospiraceae bacterium]